MDIIIVKGDAVMANTNINIRMDSDLKKQFEAFCADMGMTMTTAFNVFARKAVREYRIPFEISGEMPNDETISKALEDAEKGIGMSKAFSSVGELMEALNADD
jgi:DNA-damage-inducible protein J